MALLIPRNGASMTLTMPSTKTVMTDPIIDTTKTIADMTYEDIRHVYNQYQQSEIAHAAEHIERIIANSQNLSTWEIARVQSVFEKFTAKYTSPLAKAMK